MPDHQPVADREAGDISIAAARQWFSNAYGLKKSITNQNTLPSTVLDVAPVWAFAQTATYLSATPIVICPVQLPGQAHTLSRFFLMFYRPSSGQITARLIIFRGVDAYATNGKAFALADFTGALASLDMSGNYSGTMHLLSNGLQVGELDPTVAGNGLLYDGGTVVASQKPWWAVSGGGSWYFDGTNIWINSDPLPGPFINQTFTPLAPTPTQGGGGTVTGPPNTNPLDAHFQNLLSNPLYVFEQYLANHEIYDNTFEFLNTDAKRFLANVTSLIDPIHDYLVAQNSSPEAQDLVSTHIATLISDPGYFTRNQNADFPMVGTVEWAKTLRFGPNGVDDEPEPNADEIALSLQYRSASIAIARNVSTAFEYAGQWYQAVDLVHGKGDAFRHAFFLALNTQDTGPIAYLFGVAHETEVPAALALAKQMDLYNNNVGIAIAWNHMLTAEAQLAGTVNAAVANGEMQYLSPLDVSGYPITQGIIPGTTQLIPTNQ